jgi:hypothetical protein
LGYFAARLSVFFVSACCRHGALYGFRHAKSEINTHICAWRYHASSTERIRAFSTSGAILASTFKTRPLFQPISIRIGRADLVTAEGSSLEAGRSASPLYSEAINATAKNETTR